MQVLLCYYGGIITIEQNPEDEIEEEIKEEIKIKEEKEEEIKKELEDCRCTTSILVICI